MKKYLYDYINQVDKLISENSKIKDETITNHLTMIKFFQHERLIHLIVTLFYALIFIIFTSLGFIHYIFFVISLILIVFLLFYIIHYFHLENGVQYLYRQYNMLKDKLNH